MSISTVKPSLQQQLNMKAGVPVLNVIVSVLYILLGGLVTYWLKLAHKKRVDLQRNHSQEQLMEMKKDVGFDRLFAVAWLKKYSLVGGCLNSNRKYLLKELLIVSVYAVTCLKINHIILWPVAFSLFLLPMLFVLLEVAVGMIEGKMANEQAKSKNQTVNNMDQNQIEIEAVNVEVIRQSNSQNADITVFRERSIVQMLTVAVLAFLTTILLYQTIFTLTNSISNSGQLNITSLLVILAIDQLAIRTASGLLAFAILKMLHRNEVIDFTNNPFVNALCQEDLISTLIELQKERLRKQLENTASPLRHRQSNNELKQQVKAPSEFSDNNAHLNLLNLQPETQSNNLQHQNHQEEDQLQRQVYLTTPEKELFQGNNDQEQSLKDRSILHELIDNKQNETVNNQLNKSTLKSHQQSKGLDDIISSKDDPINDAQNFKTDFNLENSHYQNSRNRKNNKRKAAKRVLKLTGNSPYLQYLPNMLKNIDKVKNAQKDKKML